MKNKIRNTPTFEEFEEAISRLHRERRCDQLYDEINEMSEGLGLSKLTKPKKQYNVVLFSFNFN